MTVTMPSSLTTTQTVTILTDVQSTYASIVCPITAVLSPSKAYASISADFKTISINASLIAVSDSGTNAFTLTVNSSNFSSSVTQKVYSFNVVISCVITNLAFTTTISNTNYILN